MTDELERARQRAARVERAMSEVYRSERARADRVRCSIPRCRADVAILVLGKPYCELHNAERLNAAYDDAIHRLEGGDEPPP